LNVGETGEAVSLKTATLGVVLLVTLLGCGRRGVSTAQVDRFPAGIHFRWAQTSPDEGLIENTVLGTAEKLYLHEEELLSEIYIESASAFPAVEGPAILLKFTGRGREKIAQLTAKADGRRLAIVVDGVVITAPKIIEPIREHATIFGYFSITEAERIANKIPRRERP
jgi:preprotein translocase subunit SecD